MSEMVYTPLNQLVWKVGLEFVTTSQHCPAARRQNHQMEICKIVSQLCSKNHRAEILNWVFLFAL